MAILKQGLGELNHGKVGRPFGFSNTCFAAASLFRNATGIKYRQLQGLTETIVCRVNAPTYSAFQKRMAKLDCTFDEKGSDNTAAAWFSDGSTRTEISLFAFDSLHCTQSSSPPIRRSKTAGREDKRLA